MEIAELVKALKSLKGLSVSTGEEREPRGWLKSGMIAFDWLVSRGKGFPLGRVIEICGDFSAGKSYVAYRVLAQAQRRGYCTVLLDTEVSYSREFGEKCGIDNEKLIVVSDVTVEKCYEFIDELLDAVKSPCVVVWDSIAATPTDKEMSEGMDVRDLTKPHLVGKGLRMVVQKLDKTCSMLLALNQLREKIADAFVREREFAPGGRAVEYHSSVKIDLKKKGVIAVDRVVRGFRIHAVVSKNRVDIPFREIDIEMRWDRDVYIPWWEGLLDILVVEGKVVENGGWYRFASDEKKWRASDFFEMLVENSDKVVEVLKDVFGEDVLEYFGGVAGGETV